MYDWWAEEYLGLEVYKMSSPRQTRESTLETDAGTRDEVLCRIEASLVFSGEGKVPLGTLGLAPSHLGSCFLDCPH